MSKGDVEVGKASDLGPSRHGAILSCGFARHSRPLSVYPHGTMERARATWTDERLDDLSRRVDDGFNRLGEDLRQQRTETNARFDALEARLGSRIDGLQRTMIQMGGGTIVAVLATLASVLATRA